MKRLINNKNFSKYFKNSSWMFLEQFLLMLSGVFVGVYIARYLGPEQFGVLSYALALVSVLTVFTRLGMESVLVRELTNHESERAYYMGTALLLMSIAAVIGMFLIGGAVYVFENDINNIWYIWIISSGLFFQTFLVIDYNFQSQVLAKYSSISKSMALALSSILKITLVQFNVDLIWFAVAYALDYVFVAVFLVGAHFLMKQESFIFQYKRYLVKPLLKSAYPMVVSGVATIALVKIDLLMIKNMLDEEQLGMYAAASKIYDGIIAFSFVLSISVLPLLIKLKKTSEFKYKRRLKQLFSFVFWGGAAVSILIALASDEIIVLLYGLKYVNSSSVLAILIWGVALASVGFLTTRYMIVEGMPNKIAKRNWIAVAINVPLNYFFINKFGIEGAAMVTVLSLFIVHVVIDWFDTELVELGKIKMSAIFITQKFIKGF